MGKSFACRVGRSTSSCASPDFRKRGTESKGEAGRTRKPNSIIGSVDPTNDLIMNHVRRLVNESDHIVPRAPPPSVAFSLSLSLVRSSSPPSCITVLVIAFGARPGDEQQQQQQQIRHGAKRSNKSPPIFSSSSLGPSAQCHQYFPLNFFRRLKSRPRSINKPSHTHTPARTK